MRPLDDPFLRRVYAAAEAATPTADPAHDWHHVVRVTTNALRLARGEGADLHVVGAAALCHELFNYPKGHPDSARSGEVCAQHARALLASLDAPTALVEAAAEAIRTHPFSLGETPATLEGKVLQDADRLDALGAIGIARCFATCTTMGRPFYHPDDPFCEGRAPEDKLWGVDHFYRKLLRVGEAMHTASARDLARQRTAYLEGFLAQLRDELG
jgi:uncharacterized protein